MFSQYIYRLGFFPPLEVHSSYHYGSPKKPLQIRQEWERLDEKYVCPRSKYNQKLLASKLPLKKLNQEEGFQIIKALPTEKVENPPEFSLFNSLNAKNFTLPGEFFISRAYEEEGYETEYFLDTALSESGLNTFMSYFSQAANMPGKVFLNSEDFIKAIPSLSNEIETSMACLVSFERTKRHMTGIYFKREDEKITAYVFDSTGISLPGFPCGHRGYSDNLQLTRAIKVLADNEITPAIMPVNTAISVQKDQFSCLIATTLFFIGMQKKAYQILDEPGITESFGDSYFFKYEHIIYITTFLPLLIGCQSRLAFLFMMDPIKNIDSYFPLIIENRANWQRKDPDLSNTVYNYFWQFAYVELLSWLNECHVAREAQPLPDFSTLAVKGKELGTADRANNEFEKVINALKMNLKDGTGKILKLPVLLEEPEPEPQNNLKKLIDVGRQIWGFFSSATERGVNSENPDLTFGSGN